MRWTLAAAMLLAMAGCPAGAPRGPMSGGGGKGVRAADTADSDRDRARSQLDDALTGKQGDQSDGAAPPPPPDKREVGLSRVDMSDEAVAAAVEPHVAAARAAAEAADWEKVIAEARAALTIDSAHTGAVLLLARAYYHKEWYAKAQAIVVQATSVSPGDASAELWMFRGLVAEALGDSLTDVEADYREAVRLRPKYARAWTNLGAVLIARERYEDAITALKNAVSQEPDLVSAHTNLGTAYRRQALTAGPGERDALLRSAEESYNAAIRADESYAPAHLNLGILYLDSAPFPDMEEVDRLRASIASLTDYKDLVGSGGESLAAEYLSAAQRQLRAHVTVQKNRQRKTRE